MISEEQFHNLVRRVDAITEAVSRLDGRLIRLDYVISVGSEAPIDYKIRCDTNIILNDGMNIPCELSSGPTHGEFHEGSYPDRSQRFFWKWDTL